MAEGRVEGRCEAKTKTNLLHVGTSAGRSTFDGLQRVANTETPVTTAISAVNGLIAEQ